MAKALAETATLTEAAAVEAKKSGRMLMQLISPGWGSSGYYSPAVLEQAATSNVIPAGTHMYADHPTDAEAADRPARSIKDLLSITTTDAHVATAAEQAAGADKGALVAEVKVVGPYREVIEDLAGAIGVSIRGSATDLTVGEADGRRGPIVEGLAHVASVDWVTRAGRGGKTLQVLESARDQVDTDLPADVLDDLALVEAGGKAAHPAATERLMAYWADGEGAAKIGWGRDGDFDRCLVELGKYVSPGEVKGLCSNLHVRATGARPGRAPGEKATREDLVEATADDRMNQLRDAVRAKHAGTGQHAYVRDQDAEKQVVHYTVHDRLGDAPARTFSQGYTVGDNDVDVALTGDPTEVKPVTQYVPVTRPGNHTTEDSKEETMGNISIEESEHRRLTEAAGRVDTLESERDTATQRADVAEQKLADRDRTDRATAIVAERAKEADIEFTALESRGLLADLPVKDGKLDEDAFTKAVDEHAATKKAAGGAGQVRGFGADTTPVDESDDDLDVNKHIAEAFPGFMPKTAVKEA